MSSNELNLNIYWFAQAEYLRGDMIKCAQDGRYVDATRNLLYLLEQLPPEQKDDEIKGWLALLRGIRERAHVNADGSTRTLRKYDEDELRQQYSREAYEQIHERLHEKLHKAGIFIMPIDNGTMFYPSEMKKIR